MILVTGATGNVGREVVSQLVERGAPVRALVRDPDSAQLPEGVEVAQGDLADPGSLDGPLRDVEAVFLIWPFTTEESIEDLGPAVAEALVRHTRRVVYLSAQAVEGSGGSWGAIEDLIEGSGLQWTFLRPTGFAANTLLWADQIRAGDVVRWPYGEAARSLIHERDVAAVAVRALTEDAHLGTRPVLTGPATVTQAEQVELIGAAIGRSLRWEELPREPARRELAAAFGDPAFADGALDAWAAFVTEPERLTTTVEEITGAPAHSFGDWALDHADDFRDP